MKKILALVLALCMLLACVAAFADDTPTGAQTPDKSVTVGGLGEGDVVNFYKLIKWVPGTGWAWVDGVEAAAGTAGVTLPTLKDITGYYDTTAKKLVDGQISVDNAGILAQVAQKLSAVDTETVAEGANSVVYNQPAYAEGADKEAKEAADADFMGLYCALVTSASPNYLYNPIFVSADYNAQNKGTDSITVENGTLSYQPAAMAKKEEVTLVKTSGVEDEDGDKMWDVAIGDTIPFTIKSVVPAYSSSYVAPQYSITDTMSDGLVLTEGSILVEIKETTATEYSTLASSDYTITPTSPTTTFTVALKGDYLKSGTVKDIKITYSAKVTTIPDENVVQKENEATVKFSNNPGDSSSYSLLEDRTNHYTFSLDANMLGNSKWENSELVKIGLNPDGTEITQKELSNGVNAGVLEGAVFGLYTDSDCKNLYNNTNVEPNITGEYTSDANGKLNISGLDAGTYYLKEISAPAGYIKSTDTWQIDIIPTYAHVNAGSYTNDDGIKVNYEGYDYLTSYKVEVTNKTTNEKVTSDFTIENNGSNKKTATTIKEPDETTKLNNTRGTELPSTGGIGTTIFYILGGLLVVGAVVILVARRKAQD